jgi:hypothetical protein
MDARTQREYNRPNTTKCPRAAGTAGGVAAKEISSMHHQRTAGRGCALARHADPSTLYLGVEEPRCR